MTAGLCVQGQVVVAAPGSCALPIIVEVEGFHGANTVSNWNLKRDGNTEVRAEKTGAKHNFDLNKDTGWDVRSDLEIEMRVASITTDEHPAVYVRLQKGEHAGSIRLREDQYWVSREMHGNDPLMRIIVNTSSIDIAGNSSVGIVVALEYEGSVQDGFAFVADVEDSFDLNSDGMFDFNDRFDAMNRYAAGELDRATAMRIITTR